MAVQIRGHNVDVIASKSRKRATKFQHKQSQEPLLYLDGRNVFLYACLLIASKMKASVLTSRTEQFTGNP